MPSPTTFVMPALNLMNLISGKEQTVEIKVENKKLMKAVIPLMNWYDKKVYCHAGPPCHDTTHQWRDESTLIMNFQFTLHIIYRHLLGMCQQTIVPVCGSSAFVRIRIRIFYYNADPDPILFYYNADPEPSNLEIIL